MENTHEGSSRLSFSRIGRAVSLVVVLSGVLLSAYWMTKWIRGDADEYRHQILGGLTISAALALLSASELVRIGRMRWTLLGTGITLAVAAAFIVFWDVRVSLLTLVGMLLIAVSIVRTAYVMWPGQGVSITEWKTSPMTLEQRRGVCAGVAALNIGFAVFMVSIVDFTRGWQAAAIGGTATVTFVGAAVTFLMLRLRLRG